MSDAIHPISEKTRTKLIAMFLDVEPTSIVFNHAKERVRTNGNGRRHGISDCLDNLRGGRSILIEEARAVADVLEKHERQILEIEVAMARAGVVRCPRCAKDDPSDELHERFPVLNRGGTGNPISGHDSDHLKGYEAEGWSDCDCCHGEGVVILATKD